LRGTMTVLKTNKPDASAPRGWVLALQTSVCFDGSGREVEVPVERWAGPPRAPRWSPSYEWARRMRKRWLTAQRARAAACPSSEPDSRKLSDGEHRFIRFLCMEAVSAWTRAN
jgi:hypothetical protein